MAASKGKPRKFTAAGVEIEVYENGEFDLAVRDNTGDVVFGVTDRVGTERHTHRLRVFKGRRQLTATDVRRNSDGEPGPERLSALFRLGQ